MELLQTTSCARLGPSSHDPQRSVQSDSVPSSSPAFGTPRHPLRTSKPSGAAKLSILPITLPPATLRPLAFRTVTKKHNLTLTSSALQLFASFIGRYCGSGWREEGLAERVLDEAARNWKKSGGGVILPGEGDELKGILRNIEESMSGGKPPHVDRFGRPDSVNIYATDGDIMAPDSRSVVLDRENSQTSVGLSPWILNSKESTADPKDPRSYLRVVSAFDQPRLTYNVTHKHFETVTESSSLLPSALHKTHFFRHRYNLIHQRLLRNESFQTSSLMATRTKSLHRSSSSALTAQQTYKLTPIANLLGRSGSNHLLLGLLTLSPTGNLTLNDLTGSIGVDIQHARPIPEDGAWFTPGMIVLVDGMYEEEESVSGLGLECHRGIGGTIGGQFVAFSIGGPPCERREVTLGVVGAGKGGAATAGGGFGWVDFMGVGSEKAVGSAMRKLELEMFERQFEENSEHDRSKIVIIGEVQLDNPTTLHFLRKVLSLYAANQADQLPMVFVLIGNFVHHAAMTGNGNRGSIEYKEFFDSLASALSDYPTILQRSSFVFVPGDNDPWPSSFSAGTATVLPRNAVPELFTSRIKRLFTSANLEAQKSMGKKIDGDASWTTNPTRLSLFGPAQDFVVFRDNISSRLRRNALRFQPISNDNVGHDLDRGDVNTIVELAESHMPASESMVSANSAPSSDLNAARKLVKTILDQGYLSPFPLSDRPVLWDHAGALQLYPLPTALVIMDSDAPPFAITYEGCHVMNPGPLKPVGRRGMAQWIEYDSRTKRGKTKEVRV